MDMFQTCRVCDCSDFAGCVGGCSWVRKDLCSRCATDVALIACSNRKKNTQLPEVPEALYQGSLFRVQLSYARRVLNLPDTQIFILSGKYGLVAMNDLLLPYELALAALSRKERDAWGEQVADDLLGKVPGLATAYMLAGQFYRTAVSPHLEWHDVDMVVPHPEGLGIGQQLAWYRSQVEARCPVY